MGVQVARAKQARDVVAGDLALVLGHPVTTRRVVYVLFGDEYGANGIWLENERYSTMEEFIALYPGTYAFPAADIDCDPADMIVVF